MDIRNTHMRSIESRKLGSQTIAPPAGHDGIGNALRSAFDGCARNLPEDMRQLLQRLDR